MIVSIVTIPLILLLSQGVEAIQLSTCEDLAKHYHAKEGCCAENADKNKNWTQVFQNEAGKGLQNCTQAEVLFEGECCEKNGKTVLTTPYKDSQLNNLGRPLLVVVEQGPLKNAKVKCCKVDKDGKTKKECVEKSTNDYGEASFENVANDEDLEFEVDVTDTTEDEVTKEPAAKVLMKTRVPKKDNTKKLTEINVNMLTTILDEIEEKELDTFMDNLKLKEIDDTGKEITVKDPRYMKSSCRKLKKKKDRKEEVQKKIRSECLRREKISNHLLNMNV